jgi:nucleotide-binding universal stress UspA family protein
VVGVFDDRAGDVVQVAARYARAFEADLSVVYVEPISLALGESPQGSLYGGNLADQMGDPTFPDDIREIVESSLAGCGVTWHAVARRGTPTLELSMVAEDEHALMFVLGTRKSGIRDSMREFLNGSVVAQLSHRQSRPVVVVPLTVVTSDEELPWMGVEEG